MAEPGDQGVMRVSDADRERAIDRLKTAFADGMLARDEFETRVGLALTSRTRADLAAVTADIPDQATMPERLQPRRSPSVKKGAAIVAVPILAGGIIMGVAAGPLAAAAFMVFLVVLGGIAAGIVAAIVRAILLAEARQAPRAGGRLPPSPGAQPDRRRPGRRPHRRAHGPNSLAVGVR